jgi:hypothetical protein
MGRARHGVAYGASDTEHRVVLIRVSGMDAKKQSTDE